jgi:N-acetylglucosaminyldiphosphoundecaprenol N-acetyl-beta-D-mannosaminyltransferase
MNRNVIPLSVVLRTERQELPPVPQLRRRQPRHTEFLGLPFSLLEQPEVIRLIAEQGGAPYRYVVTPNAYHVVAVHDEPERLLPAYRGAWLSLCDSQIVRALARLGRVPLPLVTGSDLVPTLLATLNASNNDHAQWRILVVGPPRANEQALRAAYPNLTVDVMPAPGGLGQSAELRRAVARACMNRSWDIALLCVGCPAQELIAQELDELGCVSGIALCVGAAIDFITGKSERAPLWLQRLGLEWAYRLIREPSRLWRRYLVESPKIFRIFMAERLAKRARWRP